VSVIVTKPFVNTSPAGALSKKLSSTLRRTLARCIVPLTRPSFIFRAFDVAFPLASIPEYTRAPAYSRTIDLKRAAGKSAHTPRSGSYL
jgi:hypothetical protein